jgi:superfamily I DNA/RNA helicase
MTAATFIPSSEQQAIFDWFATSLAFGNKSKHLVVRARAGSGKTTTILKAISFAPESDILLCAFNKDIATVLQQRLDNPNAQAKTLHALGFAAVMKNWRGVKVDNVRAQRLADAVCGPQVPEPVKKLVANLHTKGREIAPHASEVGDLTDLAIRFECEPDESWAAEGFTLEYVETKALEAMVKAAEAPSNGVIDFSDMIYLPLRNNWLTPKFNLVVGDEAQDWTNAQLEMMQRVCRGRIAVVGDDRQAIYGFRGADSESLDRLKLELGAAELGLTTTYRCGRAIVALAAGLVPDFRAGENNPEGVVRDLAMDKLFSEVANGDFVLSRVNAPLVSIAMKLLREGKRARIKGRDIGKSLTTLVRKLATGVARESVPQLIDRIGSWKDKEMARLIPQLNRESGRAAAESKMAAIEDQAETLINIAEGATSVSEVLNRIDHLFTDDGMGMAGVITCSSVHKAKGLEAERVFVLAKTLRGGSREEENIAYVAYTRAKMDLVLVRDAEV